jgi:hypothetical protein
MKIPEVKESEGDQVQMLPHAYLFVPRRVGAKVYLLGEVEIYYYKWFKAGIKVGR